MRRALAVLAALVLALTPAAIASARKKPTLKQRCAKSAYAKHHRKQCKRYKKKRTSQTKTTTHTQTSAPQSLPPAPLPPAPSTGTPQDPTAPATHIGVVAREFSLTLSRTSVSAGAASIQLQNFGEDPHDLRVVRTDGTGSAFDFTETASHENQTHTVTLAPGTYKLYCTLPGHDAAGMHTTLSVGG